MPGQGYRWQILAKLPGTKRLLKSHKQRFEVQSANKVPDRVELPIIYTETFDNFVNSPQWIFDLSTGIVDGESGKVLHIFDERNPIVSGQGQIADTQLDVRMKLQRGEAHLIVRQSSAGLYRAAFNINGQVTLLRYNQILATVDAPVAMDAWHNLGLGVVGGVITVKLNDVPIIEVVDENPLPPGMTQVTGDYLSGSDFLVASFSLSGLISDVITIPEISDDARRSRLIESPLSSSDASIVFSSTRNGVGTYNLYTSREDGMNAQPITADSSANLDAAWSRDGQKIAFASNRNGNFDIFIINADGTNLQQVTSGTGIDRTPTWNGNDTELHFLRSTPPSGLVVEPTIFKVNVASGVETPLITGNYTSPSTSLDGVQIAVFNQEDPYTENHDLLVIKINQNNALQRFVPVKTGFNPSWANQNNWIVSTSTVTGQLSVVDAGSGNLLWSYAPGISVFEPEWSSTDHKIVFASSGEIYTMYVQMFIDPAERGLVNISNHPSTDISPDWRPSTPETVPQITLQFSSTVSLPTAYTDVPVGMTVTNNTAEDITNWTLELRRIAVANPPNNENYQVFIPLALVNEDGGAHNGIINSVLNQDPRLLYGQESNFADPIPAGGLITRQPTFRPRTGGAIWLSYKFTSTVPDPNDPATDITTITEGLTTVMQAKVTDIIFTDELKSLMFWIIFNETSEDTDETPYIPFPNEPPLSGLAPSTAFLRGSPYCSSFSLAPGQNEALEEQTNSGWDTDIAYLYHCNPSYRDPVTGQYASANGDHRYNDAQAIINGFLNQERRAGASTIYLYATSNFLGSLGKGDYVLWLDEVSDCPDAPIGNYSEALASRDSQLILTWLHKYRLCVSNSPHESLTQTGRHLIYAQAVNRIMPQIEQAVADFLVYPRLEPANNGNARRNVAVQIGEEEIPFRSCVAGVLQPDDGSCAFTTPIEDVVGATWQTAVENAYAAHVQQLKTYNTTFPTIIRPVLRIDRAAVRDTATNDIVRYDHLDYSWISIAYQQPVVQAEADRRHIPR